MCVSLNVSFYEVWSLCLAIYLSTQKMPYTEMQMDQHQLQNNHL